MKINSPSTPKTTAPTSKPTAQAQAETKAATPAPTGWKADTSGQRTTAARAHLTAAATHAVSQVLSSPEADSTHPLLEKFGEGLGLSLGVIVTEALALLPKWNKPVLDANGKPVEHLPGVDRVGQHDILARHQEVVGPKIAALVEKMEPGAVHDLLEGLGRGATRAPGASYRLEAAISDAFTR